MTQEEMKRLVKNELRGILEDIWIKDNGLAGEFVLIPRGNIPDDYSAQRMKQAAGEVAEELR